MEAQHPHRLHLGMTTREEVAAYIEAFLVAFTQGSGDAFGRLSKVRSELRNMLWTHPSGSRAGIVDALEYLDQLLQEYYGISLELDASDDGQLRGLESVTAAQKHRGPTEALEVLLENMQQHTKQGSASSMQKKHSIGGVTAILDAQARNTDPTPFVLQLCSDTIEATHEINRQTSGQAGVREGQMQSATAIDGVKSQTPIEGRPAHVPAAHSEHTSMQMPPAGSGMPEGSSNSLLAQGAAQVPHPAWVPDSMAMDTSTLRELSVVPSAQGLLPVSLKSPLPLTAACTKKATGLARTAGAAEMGSRLRTKGSALPRQAQRPTRQRTPVGSWRQAAPWASAEPQRGGGATKGVRGVQPVARKQLSFAAGAQHGSAGKAHVGRQAPDICKMGSLRAQQAGASVPAEVLAAAQLMHQQVPRLGSTRQSTGASSDSDSPRVASARLPKPVQQLEAYNPLFDLHQDPSRELRPPQQPAAATAAGSRSSGQAQAVAGLPDPPRADQAAAATIASALTQQAQAEKLDVLVAQGGGPWLGHMTAMSAAMAATALAGGAAGGGPSFQQGSTHYNNCHFTHAAPAYATQTAPALATTIASQAVQQPSQACEAAAGSQSILKHGEAQASGSASRPKPSGSPAQPVSKPQQAPGGTACFVGFMASQMDASSAGSAGSDLEAGSAPRRSLLPGQAPLEAELHKQSSMRQTHGQVAKRRVRFKPAGVGAAAGTLRSCAQGEPRTKEAHRAGNTHRTMKLHTAGGGVKGKGLKTRDRAPSGSHEGQAAQSAEAQQTQQQPVFDYARALASLDGQNVGSLQQLPCAGPSGREAVFQPLAALLLQPRALQRSESGSDGSGKSGRGPVQAPCSVNTASHALRRPDDIAATLTGSSEGSPAAIPADAPDLHRLLAGRIGEGSLGFSEAQAQLAERIADTVAARLSHKAKQISAESTQPAHSRLLQLQDPTAHPSATAPEAPAVAPGSQLQMPAGLSDGFATEPSLQSSAEGDLLKQACEQERLADAHQGSPVRPGGSGQPKGAEGYEQDFLAALLLGTPGSCPGQLRHAASPGLMHRQACTENSGSASAESRGSASATPEPWTEQWAGRLTQQQMQHAVQEVIGEELQSIFSEWQDTAGSLPDLCCQIAVETGQERSGHESAASRTCASQCPHEPYRQDGGGARLQARPDAPSLQLPRQPCSGDKHNPVRMPSHVGTVNASPAALQQPVAGTDSSPAESAAGGPIKETFMHAVLQSLADICGEQLSRAPGHAAQQGSFIADAAQAAHANSSAPGCSPHSVLASPAQITSVTPANACTAQHNSQQRRSQDRRTASSCRLKAGVHSIARRTKRAAQLTRLKGTLRRARLPRPVFGATLASPAQDSTSTQSAIAANTPAGPEQYSLAAVDHSSGQPKSGNDQRECVSEASQGPQRRAQQASGDLIVSTAPSWRTQESKGCRGSSGYSFSVTGAAERLLEESSPGIRMYSSSDPPATSTKRDEKRPAAGASQGGPTRQDNSISSSRRLAMRELNAPKLRVGGTESARSLANQESSCMMAGKSQDPSAERRQDRRPKHVPREASSGRARNRHAHAARSSMDRMEREYRRQKAIAAKLRAKEPRREQVPPRREGVTERRRRLTAEAGLTDSLLFSSNSEADAGLSSDCGSNGSGSASKHVTGTHSTLSSLSSAASTPRPCMEPSTPERMHAQGGSSTPDVLTQSSSHADTSLTSRSHVQQPNKTLHHNGGHCQGACTSSSHSSSSAASAHQPSTRNDDRRTGAARKQCAPSSATPAQENWKGLGGPCRLPGNRAAKYEIWGASQHLQDRLAAIRIPPSARA